MNPEKELSYYLDMHFPTKYDGSEYSLQECLEEISQREKLSEEFIRFYKKDLNMRYVAAFQKLSIDFIKENLDILELKYLTRNFSYSKEEFDIIYNVYKIYKELM
jgi:hypothetical protein